ncbi:hypothetical protein R1sor_002402 [Riccia sorocarpa]|uniref:Uncharacterized protein n=1 Tax=Riccia sorocarpa TaxID=122646 RepID=A0ABD3H1U7_9MARC
MTYSNKATQVPFKEAIQKAKNTLQAEATFAKRESKTENLLKAVIEQLERYLPNERREDWDANNPDSSNQNGVHTGINRERQTSHRQSQEDAETPNNTEEETRAARIISSGVNIERLHANSREENREINPHNVTTTEEAATVNIDSGTEDNRIREKNETSKEPRGRGYGRVNA